MSLEDLIKEKETHQEGQDESKKKDFHQKCLILLSKIKDKSEEKYHELSHTFHQKFASPNTQKKIIMGFYAQLIGELKALDPTPVFTKTAHNINTKFKSEVKSKVQATKKEAKAIVKKANEVKGQVSKQVESGLNNAKTAAKDAMKKAAQKVEQTKKEVKKEVAQVVKRKASVHKKAEGAAKKVVAKSAGKGVQKKTVKKAAPTKKKTVSRKGK